MCVILLIALLALLVSIFAFLLLYLLRHHCITRFARIYIRLNKIIKIYNMVNEILDDIDLNADEFEERDTVHKDKLSSLIGSGLIKKYTGKTISQESLDKMSDEEIEHLYAVYELKLGQSLSAPMRNTLLNLYSITINHMYLLMTQQN